MKKQNILFFLGIPFFALLLTACGRDEFFNEDDSSYQDDNFGDDTQYEDENLTDAETPLTAADCYEDETYDPDTQSCYIEISCADDADCDRALAELYTAEELANLQIEPMSADQCLPGENYDADEQVCYIECDSDEQCNQLAAEIYSGLDVYLTDSYSGQANNAPSQNNTAIETTNNNADLPNDLSGGDPELPTIARYTLNNNLDLQLAGIDNTQADNLGDEARYQEIWAFLRRILPSTLLKSDVAEYHIFSDGVDETLAYVSPLANDPTRWLIGIDIADVGASGKINTGDFVHTVIHEFSHILTLEDNQVPPDTSNVTDGEESDIAQACATFYTGEGCALAGSYINQFFNKFWVDVYYNEFQDVEWAETDEEYYDKLYAFYDQRQDWFVSEYAATNPGEDISESFTFFVLQDEPTGNSIAEQKIRFFYDYPELVAMRNHIRGELARLP